MLLVDDEVNAISALTMLLGDEGFEVAGVTSGEEALARAASERPAVAVLDVQMPGMSGLTLLECLREQHPGLSAVIMSGHMEHLASIAEARRNGDVSYAMLASAVHYQRAVDLLSLAGIAHETTIADMGIVSGARVTMAKGAIGRAKGALREKVGDVKEDAVRKVNHSGDE